METKMIRFYIQINTTEPVYKDPRVQIADPLRKEGQYTFRKQELKWPVLPRVGESIYYRVDDPTGNAAPVSHVEHRHEEEFYYAIIHVVIDPDEFERLIFNSATKEDYSSRWPL